MDEMTFGSHATETPKGMYAEMRFPLLGNLDQWTDDGRFIESEDFGVPGLQNPELGTSPIMYLEETTEQHLKAVLAGYIDQVQVNADGSFSGLGWAEDSPVGRRMATAVHNKVMQGNSVDLSFKSMSMKMADATGDEVPKMMRTYRGASLRATTVLPIPAFPGAFSVCPSLPDGAEATVTAYSDNAMAELGELVAFDAADIVKFRAEVSTKPDKARFEDPELAVLTPVQVDEDGRVYGHLAGWDTQHLSAAVRPPHSRTDYAWFATKAVLTSGGKVPTGALVLGGNHADEQLRYLAAMDHYAATCTAWADVSCGEDKLGIWVAGQVRPGTDEKVVYAGRASALSGDWRSIGGSLDLIAALSVNAPGFPIPRPAAFAEEGEQVSLTAAGLVLPAKPEPKTVPLEVAAKVELALPPLFEQHLAREEARRITADW